MTVTENLLDRPPLGERLDARIDGQDDLQRLLFLICELLELQKRGESLPTYPQSTEDGHGCGNDLLDLLDHSQFHIDGCQVEGDARDLVGEVPLQETCASP